MKYSFDDIKPMKLNGSGNSRAPTPLTAKKEEREEPKAEIKKKSAPRVTIPSRDVPWSDVPPHKIKSPEVPTRAEYKETHHSSKRIALFVGWFVIVALALGGILYAGYYFRRATILIAPKVVSGNIGTSVLVTQSGTFPAVIPYETMTLSDTLDQTVMATKSVEANEKAKGAVILYNKTTSSVSLASGTRLSSANGKIYKLTNKVTIPAQKKVQGVTTPGQIEATVEAQTAGTDYNGPLTDFSIVAYKGTSKYTTVYARSKTPLEGGATGSVFTITGDDLSGVKAKVSDALTKKLLEAAEKQVPEGYNFFKDAALVTVSVTVPDLFSEHASITVHGEGTVTAVLIPKDAFAYSVAHAIDSTITPDTKLEDPDTEHLSVKLSNDSSVSLTDATTLTLDLSGSSSVRYSININALVAKVHGVEKEAVKDIISKEPGVGSAILKLSPFYAKRLPDDTKNIHVTIE